MSSVDEQILKVSKEIIVKFIETGRVSPTSFGEVFKNIYQSVEETVKGTAENVSEQQNKKEKQV